MALNFNSGFEFLKNNLAQIPGFKSDKKYIIFESDDWGSLRVGTKDALSKFKKKGLRTDDPYIQYDTIATENDLSNLFEILSAFKDLNGNNPIITANMNIANPDFEKIRNSQFTKYYYECFTKTIEKLGDRGNPIRLWKEGIQKRLIKPQFHGREHLNIGFWLNALKAHHNETLYAFDCNSYGLITNTPFSKKKHYLAAFDFFSFSEIVQQSQVLTDGINLFYEIFGFYPTSFIAPQYIWHLEHEKKLKELGIKYIQGHRKQIVPLDNNLNYKKKFHYSGQRNIYNQFYLSRNCYFEPNLSEKDWVDSCLNDIKTAFNWRKPAIIGTHRVNFVTKLNSSKIKMNLKNLKYLLNQIKLRWPDVNFVSTDDLGSIMDRSCR